MKKVVFVFGLLVSLTLSVNAQDIADNAIGLRLSGGNGAGGEISYQKALGNNNRLEIDLGLANEFANFKATGLYQWVWSLEEQFNWYAGFGGGIVSANGTGIYGAGVIGIEYDFNAPVLLSLDYRPEIGVAGGLDGLNSSFSLAVRYQF
jgi:opacity protein-like surface antigen